MRLIGVFSPSSKNYVRLASLWPRILEQSFIPGVLLECKKALSLKTTLDVGRIETMLIEEKDWSNHE